MGISSMYNGKKNQTQPHRDKEPSGPLCKNALGLEGQAAHVALAQQHISEGPATVQGW